MSSQSRIALRNLSLTYPGTAAPVEVLRGLELEAHAGETIAVVGPSGSGKSSLMMIIAGLERASGGQVNVCGHDLSGMEEDELARFRREEIGIVFQDYHLIPTMTALENVAIPMEFAGRGDAFERAAEVLEQVGLGERLTHYPGQLSGGEQQRVAVARAFAVEPSLLLADEPTGNLDQATGAKIVELLFGLQEHHGTTLLLITHDPSLAARCERTVRLRNGGLEETPRGPSLAAAGA